MSFKATLTLFHHSTTTTFVTFFSSTKPVERSYQTVLKGAKSISKYLLKIKILIDSTDTLDTAKHSDWGKMDTLHTSKHTDQGKIQLNYINISFVLLFLCLVLFLCLDLKHNVVFLPLFDGFLLFLLHLQRLCYQTMVLELL